MADQGTEGLLSPFLRHRRIAAAKPYLKGNILDVGCGTGSLAHGISPDCYCGVEIDQFSLEKATADFPEHRFQETLPAASGEFDTVVALAVIEHVPNPAAFLISISGGLKRTRNSRVVITTPHPAMDWIHDLGATIGLFSRHASEEHEELLDRGKMTAAGRDAGLNLVSYRRFLLGANQLAVFEPQL